MRWVLEKQITIVESKWKKALHVVKSKKYSVAKRKSEVEQILNEAPKCWRNYSEVKTWSDKLY